MWLEIYNLRIQILPTKIIWIKRIFKTVSQFFLLLCGFWEISNYLAPRIIADSVYSSCTTEDFKAILLYVRDLDLAKCNTLQPKEKAKQQFHKPIVTSIFPRNLLCYLIFHLPNFFLSHLLNINNRKQPFNCARKTVVL